MKLSVTSWPPLSVQYSCSNVITACHFSASSMDRVAGVVAEWFSPHERLIFQSVSKNTSLQLECPSAKCGILSRRRKLLMGISTSAEWHHAGQPHSLMMS